MFCMAFVLQPHNKPTPLCTCTMGGPVLQGYWFILVCALGPKFVSRVNLIYIFRKLAFNFSAIKGTCTCNTIIGTATLPTTTVNIGHLIPPKNFGAAG